MIGRNELMLNEATMIEAVQQWADRNMAGAKVNVTSVKQDRSLPHDTTFCVVLEAPSKEV